MPLQRSRTLLSRHRGGGQPERSSFNNHRPSMHLMSRLLRSASASISAAVLMSHLLGAKGIIRCFQMLSLNFEDDELEKGKGVHNAPVDYS